MRVIGHKDPLLFIRIFLLNPFKDPLYGGSCFGIGISQMGKDELIWELMLLANILKALNPSISRDKGRDISIDMNENVTVIFI